MDKHFTHQRMHLHSCFLTFAQGYFMDSVPFLHQESLSSDCLSINVSENSPRDY